MAVYRGLLLPPLRLKISDTSSESALLRLGPLLMGPLASDWGPADSLSPLDATLAAVPGQGAAREKPIISSGVRLLLLKSSGFVPILVHPLSQPSVLPPLKLFTMTKTYIMNGLIEKVCRIPLIIEFRGLRDLIVDAITRPGLQVCLYFLWSSWRVRSL